MTGLILLMALIMTNLLPKTIEQIANEVFEIRDKPEPPKTSKSIRKLFKDKTKISKQIDFTRSPDKLLKLKIKLIVIETELSANKENYLIKKIKKNDVISKITSNPKEIL